MERVAFVVHDLDHALAVFAAAAAAGRPVALFSGRGAGAYLGAEYFRQMVARARARYPEVDAEAVLDCGDRAGDALAAIRNGIEAVRLEAPPAVLARVREIAAARGARLVEAAPGTLDLGEAEDPAAACRERLAGAAR